MSQTNDFVKTLAKNSKTPQRKIKRFFNSFISVLSDVLNQDEKISITNLGFFDMRLSPAYNSEDNKVPAFYPSQNLKKSMNNQPNISFASKKTIIPTIQVTNNPSDNENQVKIIPVKMGVKKIETTENPNKKTLWQALFGTKRNSEPQIENPEIQTNNTSQKPENIQTIQNANTIELNNQINKNKSSEIQNAQKEIISALKNPIPNNVNTTYIDLKNKKISKKILAKIPEYIARLYQAVPVEEKDGRLIVAMVDPEDYQAIEFMKKKTGSEIKPVLATQEDIAHVFSEYSGLDTEIKEEIKDSDFGKISTKTEKTNDELTKTDAPTSRAVQSILRRAVTSEASDIHIEPYENEIVVRFRIDGILQNIISLPKSIQTAIISRIKILSNMKIDETRLPQDGRFELTIDKRNIDFRISIFPTVYGEKAVMRILDKTSNILTLEELGVRGSAFDVLNDNINKSHGMILVTGPTGSGKTTTLYAILEKLNKEGVNIITLEDPVEYQIKGINQGQVKTNIGFTFAKGLRSIVRQDPDIIMVGEIRDLETAEMAVQAALTGHIVLSTLHTNDAAGAVPRLIDMGIEPFLLTSSINSVIAQRLCRKICDNCKAPIDLPNETLNEIKNEISKMPQNLKNEKSKKELIFYQGKGCDACNKTGYKGRVGIFEIFNVTETIKDLAAKKVSASELERKAIEEGMLTMKQDGILKALDGITTIEEILRVTRE